MIPISIYDDAGDDEARRLRKRHSVGVGLRTESYGHGAHLKSSSPFVYDPFAPRNYTLSASSKKADRRNSLHSYVATSSSLPGLHSSSGRGKLHGSGARSLKTVQQKVEDVDGTDSDIAIESSSFNKPSRSTKRNRSYCRKSNAQGVLLGPDHCHGESEQSTSWDETPKRHKRASQKRLTIHYPSNLTPAKSVSRRYSLQSGQSRSQQSLTGGRNTCRLKSPSVPSVPRLPERVRSTHGSRTPADLNASPSSQLVQPPC